MKTGLDFIVRRDTYAEYLRRLDARALLDHYGAERCFEQSGSDGTTEIVHSCLLDRVEPHHTNGDANPSACCNIDKKVYVCYALGFGCDLFHLVQKLENKESFADSLTVIGQFLSGATLETDAWRAEVEKNLAMFTKGGYHLDLPVYSDRILESWDRPHVYWDHRGISHQAQALLRLGYDERERRIVFPHFVNNRLVGWQKRVIPGETHPDYPKYRNSSGFPKSETLYGLDLASFSGPVVVVESPMSVARAYSVGLQTPVVATFGAKVSTAQIDALRRFDAVYVWFDRDAAGLTGERNLTTELYEHTAVYVVAPDGGIDMGDCDRAEMEAKLSTATAAALRLGEYETWKLVNRGRQATEHSHIAERGEGASPSAG